MLLKFVREFSGLRQFKELFVEAKNDFKSLQNFELELLIRNSEKMWKQLDEAVIEAGRRVKYQISIFFHRSHYVCHHIRGFSSNYLVVFVH